MKRIKDILNEVQEELSIGQKTYDGKKRSDLKDSDFLFPETKSFPIVTPQDVKDAISNYGRMNGKMSYDEFLRKLYNKCKNKGPEFVAALPEASKEKLGIDKKAKSVDINNDMAIGSMVVNTDHTCAYYMSRGMVEGIDTFPEPQGKVVAYKTTNTGPNWSMGQVIKKNMKHLALATDFSNDDSRNTEYNNLPLMAEESEDMNEFLAMALTGLKTIAIHAKNIYNSSDDPKVIENLTEAWVLAKIAVMEDHMRCIRDYVIFGESDIETEEAESSKKPIKHSHQHKPKNPTHVSTNAYPISRPTTVVVQPPQTNNNELNENHNEIQEDNVPTETEIANKPGLWDNIRKKKEREGKNYKPAKPGDKDRPDPDQWKKLTK